MEINNEIVAQEVRFSKDNSIGRPYMDKMRVSEITEYNEYDAAVAVDEYLTNCGENTVNAGKPEE